MTQHFDFCISNPPYQMSTSAADSDNNGATNIFHEFFFAGLPVARHTVMIFPGGRWMQRTARCKSIADELFARISSVEWFANGGEPGVEQIFHGTVIRDGVSIVHSDETNLKPTIHYNGQVIDRPIHGEVYPLDPREFKLVAKVMSMVNRGVTHRKFPRMVFGLTSTFVEKNPTKVSRSQGVIPDAVRAFLGNETPGSAKRVEPFWLDRHSVKWTPTTQKVFSSWKVVGVQGSVSKTPSAGGYRVVANDTVTGESLVVVGSFGTEEEANNYLAYLRTNFAKFLMDAGKGGKMEHWGAFLPDLEEWDNTNPLFTPCNHLPDNHCFKDIGTLEQRLAIHFKLTDAEQTEIHNFR